MPFSGKNAAFCHISTASNYFRANFFDKNRAAPLSIIFPRCIAAHSRNRRTNPIRNAPQHNKQHNNIIIYAHIHTCTRARAYTYLTLIYLCIPKALPPPPRNVLHHNRPRKNSRKITQSCIKKRTLPNSIENARLPNRF